MGPNSDQPGVSLRELAGGDWAANLTKAIACYQDALASYTETGFPADWAMTQGYSGGCFGGVVLSDSGEILVTSRY